MKFKIGDKVRRVREDKSHWQDVVCGEIVWCDEENDPPCDVIVTRWTTAERVLKKNPMLTRTLVPPHPYIVCFADELEKLQ